MKTVISAMATLISAANLVGCGLPSDKSDSTNAPESTQSTTPEGKTINTSTGGKIVISSAPKSITIPKGHKFHGISADSNGIYMLTASDTIAYYTKSADLESQFIPQCPIAKNNLAPHAGMAWDGASLYLLRSDSTFEKFSGTDCSSEGILNTGAPAWAVKPPFVIEGGKIYWNRATKQTQGIPWTSTNGALLASTDLTTRATDSVVGNTGSGEVKTQFGIYTKNSDSLGWGAVSMTTTGSVIWSLHALSQSNVYLWKISKWGEVIGWVKIPREVLPDTSLYPIAYHLASQNSMNLMFAIQDDQVSASRVTITNIDVSSF